MNTQSGMTLAQAADYIQSMDFSRIIDKLVRHMGWAPEHALEACQMYRRFLFLHKKYGHQHTLPPSEDMDEFWHMHILDTKRYREDCHIIFGRYLDHYPYLGIDGITNITDTEKAFATTQRLYALEFNKEEIVEVRSTWAKFLSFVRICSAQKPKRNQPSYTPEAHSL